MPHPYHTQLMLPSSSYEPPRQQKKGKKTVEHTYLLQQKISNHSDKGAIQMFAKRHRDQRQEHASVGAGLAPACRAAARSRALTLAHSFFFFPSGLQKPDNEPYPNAHK